MYRKLKVSVLLPVYNGAPFLKEAIESILNQTFKDFEFLIINDGSTDSSIEIVKSFNDPRIILIENTQNIGLVKTLNKGLSLARGEYIARMDQDDISLPNRLLKQVNFMDMNPDCGVCGSWIRFFGNARIRIIKYETDPEAISAQLLFLNPLAHPSTILRREILSKFNINYDISYENCEDYELWTRIVNFSKICNIPEVLLNYRISKGQMTRKYQDEQNKMMRIIKKRLLLDIFKNDISDKDIFIHQNLGAYDSPSTIEFINKATEWLKKIRNVNLEKKIYSDENFSKVIGMAYRNLLIKNVNLGSVIIKKLLFSKLSKYIKLRDKIIVMMHYLKSIKNKIFNSIINRLKYHKFIIKK